VPMTRALLDELERYYDAVPRVTAVVEEIGPFTLFLRGSEHGWQFYARPHLGYAGSFSVEQVDEVRARQREAGAPEAFEWVADTTPALEAVVRDEVRVLARRRDGVSRGEPCAHSSGGRLLRRQHLTVVQRLGLARIVRIDLAERVGLSF